MPCHVPGALRVLSPINPQPRGRQEWVGSMVETEAQERQEIWARGAGLQTQASLMEANTLSTMLCHATT